MLSLSVYKKQPAQVSIILKRFFEFSKSDGSGGVSNTSVENKMEEFCNDGKFQNTVHSYRSSISTTIYIASHSKPVAWFLGGCDQGMGTKFS